MADIFGGANPPSWLVDATRQTPGELGSIAGLAFGGVLNALQEAPPEKVPVKDPKTGEVTMQDAPKKEGFTGWLGSRKGLAQGLGEARLNTEDPLWRLKVAQTQASILGTMAQTQSALALAEERKQETAAWMKDAPSLSPWLSATPEQRKSMPEPTATSKQGMIAIQRKNDADQRYFNQQDANKIKQEQADNASAAAKAATVNTKTFYDELKLVTSGEDQARILGMTKNGMPTPEAWAELSKAPKKTVEEQKTEGRIKVEGERQKGREALEDQRQEGRKALEEQKQEGRESLADINAQNKKAFEEQRQKDRVELKKMEGEIKVDIAKMRLGATDSKGRVVSEDEYVNRHFNTLFNAAWKEADVKDVRRITADVEKALRLRWRTEHKGQPKAPDTSAAPATSGTNQTATATAPAPATAVAAGATTNAPPGNDISFDDFQNWLKGK